MSHMSSQDKHKYTPAKIPSPQEQKRIWAAWYQAMELSHTMLLAGLGHRIGPDGDLQEA